MTSGTSRLLQQIAAGKIGAANAQSAIEQAGGAELVLLELFRAMAEAAGQGSGGGDLITDPNVAYIRSDGDDETGDGTPGAPYATFQNAIDAGFRVFDLGVGNFGAGSFTSLGQPQVITIRAHRSVLESITNYGLNLTVTVTGELVVDEISVEGNEPNYNGGQLIVYGGTGLVVGSVYFQGGSDGEGFDGDGGTIELNGPFRVTGQLQGGSSDFPSGWVYLTQGVLVPMPQQVDLGQISVKFAIVAGQPHVEASSLE